ncbi:FAD-binding protein [Lawsonella clevelandensis]|uniref:3-oxo-5-alpha-steroid 4-dehydrogenase n=3 Tax=Lawsonella clevelandensis TaxID=1528099 RepID=A0A5E3ZXP8_9ACTN|nr:FAD-binding protein [Lawsonella clevelandensis]VHO00558.1 3-oxo-5-alpha-steroid 4-dehydrogenase [Lawsonella clevelandensis]
MSSKKKLIPDDSFDVVVVGFGGAGAAAAIEAADNGARVLALDLSIGGGATRLSGGIVYAGGGTSVQKGAGVEDTVENMFNYIKQEAQGVVSDDTLRDFCEQSPGMIEWLKENGVGFDSSLCPYKASYPTDKHYLYFSGNEKAYPYNEHAFPAPRGHRAKASGLKSGKVLYNSLKDSALKKGVTFLPVARVSDLVIENGKVVGVKFSALNSEKLMKLHWVVTKLTAKLGNFFPDQIGRPADKLTDAIWKAGKEDYTVHCDAVILSAGGFAYNTPWMEKYTGPYAKITPLGTGGDSGKGIMLGQSAGGAIAQMDKATSWRFISPPEAFIEGVSVGTNGHRVTNEDLYGATHSNVMVREYGANCRLILDHNQWIKAMKQVPSQSQIFHWAMALYLFSIGHKKANTIEELAKKTGVDPAGLRKTIDEYNEGIAAGTGDPYHKAANLTSPVLKAPFYAIDISNIPNNILNGMMYPAPGLTLGGLQVNEKTGNVVNEKGEDIPGLYAAGRNAVGVCSNSYVSGLSIADCFFSGRRAGRNAAAATKEASKK